MRHKPQMLYSTRSQIELKFKFKFPPIKGSVWIVWIVGTRNNKQKCKLCPVLSIY